MKKDCHWRVVGPDGDDYYGGKAKAKARKLQKKLGGGRLYNSCSKPKGHKSVKPASTLLQWTIIIVGVTAVWMVLK